MIFSEANIGHLQLSQGGVSPHGLNQLVNEVRVNPTMIVQVELSERWVISLPDKPTASVIKYATREPHVIRWLKL